MRTRIIALLVGMVVLVGAGWTKDAEVPDFATLKPYVKTGFSNGGWNYDRYQELERLDAGKRMLAADLKGPGIIRSIHTTRHNPKEMMARGIVLEIWFDDAKTPAVQCPLADFFGDGCNGSGMDFTSNLIECAPWSYNCYIPMPFKKRARVYFRNDTKRNAMNYCYVEWEPLKRWKKEYGYFHATYRRDVFQIHKETNHTFLELEGTGQILGRQFSVITNEPFFNKYNTVMEGNNEIDIDGQERVVDYLGTEDSFTFSWGFNDTFAGLYAGMTLIDVDNPALQRLSIYRFHDYMPIRFKESLKWSINWSHEVAFTRNPAWHALVAKNGCWLDYAAVHYWYQDNPGGYKHAPMRPLEERSKTHLCPERKHASILKALGEMKVDTNLINTLDSKSDADRVRVIDCMEGTPLPLWIDRTGKAAGNPNPGRTGVLALHPQTRIDACYAMRKVKVPAQGKSVLNLAVSGDPYESPGRSDFVLQVGICDGKNIEWRTPKIVTAGTSAKKSNWVDLSYSLQSYSGKEIGIIVKIGVGGKLGRWNNEEAFLDDFSVRIQ
jgi:Protein of unknown function (DUF2961)